MSRIFSAIIIAIISAIISFSSVLGASDSNSALINVQPDNLVPPSIEVFVRAPVGTFPTPYVIITGLTTGLDESTLRIEGRYGQKEFSCLSNQCALTVQSNDTLVVTAVDDNGNKSEPLTAEIEILQNEQGYTAKIVRLGKFIYFTDACGAAWSSNTADKPSWSQFPQDPYELNTSKDLHFLGRQLVDQGVLDLKSCPNNGLLGAGLSACGLELARPHLEYWQNQFDLPIWRAAAEEGIPPKVLKTLIETETQFWPITSDNRLHIDEFGLAQITENGIDILLRTDPDYYYEVCNEALADCKVPYVSLPAEVQYNLRTYLTGMLNTDCPTCAFGRSLDKAAASIDLIARVLKANCLQASPFISYGGEKMSYEDSWKVTLAIYNAGIGCVSETYKVVTDADLPLNWDTFSKNFTCVTGTDYVDKLWYSLVTFDQHRKTDYELEIVTPELVTETGAVPYITTDTILVVHAFQDANSDGIFQDGEGLDGIEVLLTLPNGEERKTNTENGIAKFDLFGQQIGQQAKVALVGFNKEASLLITPDDEILIIFPFLPQFEL